MSAADSLFPRLSWELQEMIVALLSPQELFVLENIFPRIPTFGNETRVYFRDLSRLLRDVQFEDNDYYRHSIIPHSTCIFRLRLQLRYANSPSSFSLRFIFLVLYLIVQPLKILS